MRSMKDKLNPSLTTLVIMFLGFIMYMYSLTISTFKKS